MRSNREGNSRPDGLERPAIEQFAFLRGGSGRGWTSGIGRHQGVPFSMPIVVTLWMAASSYINYRNYSRRSLLLLVYSGFSSFITIFLHSSHGVFVCRSQRVSRH
jgi:hypothetical protein